jgi:hypothetical protein
MSQVRPISSAPAFFCCHSRYPGLPFPCIAPPVIADRYYTIKAKVDCRPCSLKLLQQGLLLSKAGLIHRPVLDIDDSDTGNLRFLREISDRCRIRYILPVRSFPKITRVDDRDWLQRKLRLPLIERPVEYWETLSECHRRQQNEYGENTHPSIIASLYCT